jgi:hypothetical protein
MKKKKFEKIQNQMTNVSINMSELESLSKILTNSLCSGENLIDIENLSHVISDKIIRTKRKFNNIEEIMKI